MHQNACRIRAVAQKQGDDFIYHHFCYMLCKSKTRAGVAVLCGKSCDSRNMLTCLKSAFVYSLLRLERGPVCFQKSRCCRWRVYHGWEYIRGFAELVGSITHPGKQEQHGPGMMGQRRQGEELARGRF